MGRKVLSLGHREADEPETVSGDMRLELASLNRKPPMGAESFVATMNSLLFTGGSRSGGTTLVVTSPEVGDGKTTVTSNLAIALSRINKQVLVIDGDMRRPAMHRVFDVDGGERGLIEFLSGDEKATDSELDRLIRNTSIENLSFLPSGSPDSFDSRLLHRRRMRELVQICAKRFDFVLIDTPPMMHISDARVWARLADKVVLVLRAGRTTREIAMAACHALTEDQTPVGGVVLNHWEPGKSSRYSRYRSYAYYARS